MSLFRLNIYNQAGGCGCSGSLSLADKRTNKPAGNGRDQTAKVLAARQAESRRETRKA